MLTAKKGLFSRKFKELRYGKKNRKNHENDLQIRRNWSGQ